jgi:ATP-dependent exoDNAse (exonuclease V) beta subunit
VEIVDYKYSSRAAAGIREHYAVQIKLYQKAAATIMRIEESAIRTTIVNIRSGEEISM